MLDLIAPQPRQSAARGHGPATGSGIAAAAAADLNRADIAGRVHVAQMDVVAQLSPGSATMGFGAIVLLAVVFWRNGPHAYLVCIVALLATVYGASVAFTIAWRNGVRPATLPAAAMRPRIAISALLGLLWSTVPLVLTPYADRDQSLMIGYLVAGLGAAGPMLAPLLPAALLFAGTIMAGAAVALLIQGGLMANVMAGLIAGYAGLVVFSTFDLHRRFTERVSTNMQLEEQREIISLLLRDFEESSSDWLWQTAADGRLQNVSARVADTLGRTPAQLGGLDLLACCDQDGCERAPTRDAWLRLKAALAQPAAFRDVVLPFSVRGEERWLAVSGKPIYDRNGAFLGFRGVGADVTAARQSEARIVHLATFDSLTDLPNRTTLADALRRACESGAPFALLCLDLDAFKAVNDTMGHTAGDALLVAAAQRMRGCVRGGDVVARLGGDEFALLQAEGTAASAEQLGRRLLERLGEPFSIDGASAAVGASVGIALAPIDGSTPEALMKASDLALYRAKHDGRGTIRFFDTDMSRSAQARSAMQADLRQAPAREELRLNYQPVLELAGRKIVAMEALMRWHHPARGAVSPAEFIPLAEEGGLILPMGAWALREACRAAARWQLPARVAVNLSPVQVRDPSLLGVVEAALAASGLPPERLELEITESLFLEATEGTLACLHTLRARGIRIALDDFGTGYSSLSYLRSFPFDKVKIDRSFVRDIVDSSSAAAIVQAITTMADCLGMITTAEGVETLDQEAVLRTRDCVQAQGFLYSRPLTCDATRRLLAEATFVDA